MVWVGVRLVAFCAVSLCAVLYLVSKQQHVRRTLVCSEDLGALPPIFSSMLVCVALVLALLARSHLGKTACSMQSVASRVSTDPCLHLWLACLLVLRELCVTLV